MFVRPLALATLLTLGTAAGAQSVSIQFDGACFQVSGWTANRTPPAKGWHSVFAVYAGAGNVPPLLGTHVVEGGTLLFRPTYPLAPGVRYRAVFHHPGGGAPIETIVNGPSRDIAPAARVERLYPSGDVLPGNQLRLYIYFSAPMSHGEAATRVRLLNETGKALSGVFLPGEELWDPQFRRLTMTFDPGRIKRGLTSNEAMGAPIVTGKRYTLVIDREWLDARGVPMLTGFRKVFRGGPEERHPPDPKQWRLTAPTAGTAGPLIVDFPKPMNYVLLQRMLRVSVQRVVIEGVVKVERQETRWIFTPRQPWKTGAYELVVDTALEDLAGNSIGKAFDIDVFERVTQRITGNTTFLPFGVR